MSDFVRKTPMGDLPTASEAPPVPHLAEREVDAEAGLSKRPEPLLNHLLELAAAFVAFFWAYVLSHMAGRQGWLLIGAFLLVIFGGVVLFASARGFCIWAGRRIHRMENAGE